MALSTLKKNIITFDYLLRLKNKEIETIEVTKVYKSINRIFLITEQNNYKLDNTLERFNKFEEILTVLDEDEESNMDQRYKFLATALNKKQATFIREQRIKPISDENKMLQELITRNTAQQRLLNHELYIDTIIGTSQDVKKEEFVRACPVETCRGFLSIALKCGICDVYACKHCLLPKNGRNDTEHQCNQDTVATVKLLASDTKSCPSCSTPIYKIHGCDQMYCTRCHTAFSWNKGTIELGVVHNPHYYEFQRSQNGGIAPRVAGDIRCGGLPSLNTFLSVTGYNDNNVLNIGSEHIHRLVSHIINVEIPNLPNRVIDNTYLRINYLRNKITDKQMLSKLKQDIKQKDKYEAIRMSLDMFVNTMSDLFGNIISDYKNADLYFNSIKELKDYTNNSLLKIGQRFENIAPYISEDFQYYRNRNKSPETH